MNNPDTIHIPQGFLNGEISAPSSKSDLIRAIFSAALFTKKTIIKNPNYCEDVLSAISIIEAFGSKVIKNKTEIIVNGSFQFPNHEMDCGESGLCIRMTSMIAMCFDKPVKLVGTGTALNRDFSDIVEGVQVVGGKIKSNNGKLPFEINGPIKNIDITINGKQTSQTITGLIFLFLKLNQPAQIKVCNPVSSSYIKLTKEVLSKFSQNIDIRQSKTTNLQLNISNSNRLQIFEYNPTIDWSGIAFFLVGAAINGNIRFKDLAVEPKHSDAIILDVLKQANVNITQDNHDIIVTESSIESINFDITDFPDLFPPLVILALSANNISTIKGIHRLKNKESDRFFSLTSELSKLGAKFKVENDSLNIIPANLSSDQLFSHNDHRIAMALVIIGTTIPNGIFLNNSNTIKKSFPTFFNQLFSLFK